MISFKLVKVIAEYGVAKEDQSVVKMAHNCFHFLWRILCTA